MTTIVRPKYVTDFDAGPHKYWYEGNEKKPLTTVLRSFGFGKSKYYNDNSRNRGSAVHLACRYLAENDLDETQLDPAIVGRVNAYKSFWNAYQPKPILVEQPICDPLMGVACTPDLVATMKNGEVAVVEIKCGVKERWHALQLAGQTAMLIVNGIVPTMRYVVYLTDNGFKLEQATDILNDDAAWATLIAAYNLRAKYGVKDDGIES